MANLNIDIPATNGLRIIQADLSMYQRVNDFLIGRFGKDSPGYKTIMNSGFNIENATGSSLPFVIATTELLKGTNIATLSLEDAVRIIAHGQANNINPFEGIYADIKEAILYSNDVSQPSTNLAGIAKNQGNISYDSENPARFIGLRIAEANTKQGYKFVETDETQIIIDPRFAYSNNEKKIEFDGTKIKVFTKRTGLSRLYVGDGNLIVWNDNLADSGGDGRVGLVHAEGVGSKK